MGGVGDQTWQLTHVNYQVFFLWIRRYFNLFFLCVLSAKRSSKELREGPIGAHIFVRNWQFYERKEEKARRSKDSTRQTERQVQVRRRTTCTARPLATPFLLHPSCPFPISHLIHILVQFLLLSGRTDPNCSPPLHLCYPSSCHCISTICSLISGPIYSSDRTFCCLTLTSPRDHDPSLCYLPSVYGACTSAT